MNEFVQTLTDGVLRHLVVGSAAALVLVLLAWAFLKAGRIRTPVYRHMVWLYVVPGFLHHAHKTGGRMGAPSTDLPLGRTPAREGVSSWLGQSQTQAMPDLSVAGACVFRRVPSDHPAAPGHGSRRQSRKPSDGLDP